MHAAKLNRERLEGCAKHLFVIAGVLQQHVVCTRCAGRVAITSAYAYAAGYVDAGKPRTDVLIEDF